MADLSTRGLLHKIRTDFGTEKYFVEVSVLDGNGDKFDVYSGRASDMTAMHLSKGIYSLLTSKAAAFVVHVASVHPALYTVRSLCSYSFP